MTVKPSATDSEGFVVFSHAGDDFRACRDHVRERLGLSREPRREAVAPTRPSAPIASTATTTADALALWDASVDPRGTLAEQYLASRGLELGGDVAGEVLRFHRGIGALVALFRTIKTGEPQAVSRIFLDREGRKRERKFLGPSAGAAVMLDAFDAVTMGLHLAEGIETALAARQLGLRPCWACGSKDQIKAFPVLGGVESLTILAEPDAEAEVRICRERWGGAGREVRIVRPIAGKDLNDAIIRGAA